MLAQKINIFNQNNISWMDDPVKNIKYRCIYQRYSIIIMFEDTFRITLYYTQNHFFVWKTNFVSNT